MNVMNEMRRLKPEQRRKLLESLEEEDKLLEDALKKNPNLHVETKLNLVLDELKDLRYEMQTIRNTYLNCPFINNNKNNNNNCDKNNNSNNCNSNSNSNNCKLNEGKNENNKNEIAFCTIKELDCSRQLNQEDNFSDCNECSFFTSSSSFDWWTIIIFVFIFISFLTLPSNKTRTCPITI